MRSRSGVAVVVACAVVTGLVTTASAAGGPHLRIAAKGLLISTSSTGFEGFGAGGGLEIAWMATESLRVRADYSHTAPSVACDCIAGAICRCEDGSADAPHVGAEYLFFRHGLAADVGGDLGFVKTRYHGYAHSRLYSAVGWRSKSGSHARARLGLSALVGEEKTAFDPYGGLDLGLVLNASRRLAVELFARADLSLDTYFGIEIGLGFLF
jgi:hypothetical protein